MIAKNIKGKTVNIKIKYEDFTTHTKSVTLEYYTNNPKNIYNIAIELFSNH